MSAKYFFLILIALITLVAFIVLHRKKLLLGLLTNDPKSAKFHQVVEWIAILIIVAVLLIFGIANN